MPGSLFSIKQKSKIKVLKKYIYIYICFCKKLKVCNRYFIYMRLNYFDKPDMLNLAYFKIVLFYQQNSKFEILKISDIGLQRYED